VSDIDIRILQLINVKALNRIDEDHIEISVPRVKANRTEANGIVTNTEITITARPEGKYKGSKIVRYRRNSLADEFAGYPGINPTSIRPVWKNIIFSEMIGLVESVLSMFCLTGQDIDMDSFGHMFPADSRGRRQLDLTFVKNNKLTIVLRPTQDNYYYNGPVTLVFAVIDEAYTYW
jgi:hypothetical protein